MYPGAPNSLFALETLTEEVEETKRRQNKPLGRMELGSRLMPLGTTNGTSNAVMFGVALLAMRDPDLNFVPRLPPPLTNHDHDAPAWWNFHRRRSLYSDGFAAKSHRALMQFLLDPHNSAAKFREWEGDFKDIYAWLDSLEPPKYPWPTWYRAAAQRSQGTTRSVRSALRPLPRHRRARFAVSEYRRPNRKGRHRPRAAECPDAGVANGLRSKLVRGLRQAAADGRSRRLHSAAARRHLGLGPLFPQRLRADALACSPSIRAAEDLASQRRWLRSTARGPGNPDV